MHRFRALAALSAVLLAALAVAFGASARQSSTAVTVTMKEFKFTFSRSSVPHGKVTFKLVNKGKLPHDLKIDGKKSPLVKPGKTGALVVTFAKKGSYPYLCTVPGHAAAGMKGKLKVT